MLRTANFDRLWVVYNSEACVCFFATACPKGASHLTGGIENEESGYRDAGGFDFDTRVGHARREREGSRLHHPVLQLGKE